MTMEQPAEAKAENPYGNLTEYLDRRTELASQASSFDERVEGISNAVAHESMLSFKQEFGGHELLKNFSWDGLEHTYKKAVQKAAEKFNILFNENNVLRSQVRDEEAAYKEAQRVKDINAEFVMEVVHHLDPELTEQEVAHIIEDTNAYTLRDMVAGQLGVDVPAETDPEAIRHALRSRVHNDSYSLEALDKMSFLPASAETQSPRALLVRRLLFGLANATWKAAQGFRASYELATKGNTKRGDSMTQSNYAPFHKMVQDQYETGGVDRAALEIDKDRDQLMGFVASVREQEEAKQAAQ